MAKRAAKTQPPRTSVDPVTRYALDVAEGRVAAGPHVRAACARHLRDLTRAANAGLSFDRAAAERIIGYFRDVLTVEVEEQDDDGTASSRAAPFVLQPWQEFIVGSLFGWKRRDGFRRFRRAYVEIGKGNGKALAIDTIIPTPDGWRQMGDLQVGDRVFDDRGSPCNVTGATAEMSGRTCYRVKFSDGAEIVADADHLWLTSAMRTGLPKGPKSPTEPRKGIPAIRTTAQIAATLTVGPSTSKHPQAKWNHRVGIAGALQIEGPELPLQPYVLGAWLGDGNTDDARLTVAYAEWGVVDQIISEGVEVSERASHSDTTARVILGSACRKQSSRNVSVQARLRSLGVLGSKHIPQVYLWASEEQRLALLQGLMDTDGTIAVGGQCELTLCCGRLADDAVQLIRSLGLKPTRKTSASRLHGRDVGIRHRIQFWAYSDKPVFRLERKFARQKTRPASRPISEGRMIVACDLVESVPVKCISVDSPSHMFLAGEHLVPTHNSPLAAGIGHYMLTATGKLRAEVYAAASQKDQAMVMFRDAVAMWERSPALNGRLLPSGVNPVWQLTDIARSSFFKPISSENKGKSGIRPYCALIDEVHEHPNADVIEMLRAGTKGNQDALIFEITNSGFDRKSVCRSEHEYTVKVVSGEIENDAWFGYIASLDEGDEPFEDETCWIKANPNLGVSIQKPFIREQVVEATGMGSKENIVRRLHFCQWTDSEAAAFSRPILEKVMGEVAAETLSEKGYPCFGGLDLSRTKDLTAFTLTWLLDGAPDQWRFASKTWFWTPKETLAVRAKKDRAPYELWVREGHFEAVPGKRIGYGWMADALLALCAKFGPVSIGCDQYGLENLRDHLTERGASLPCVVHPQGFQKRKVGEAFEAPAGAEDVSLWMPDSINKLEAAILEERIVIDPNPGMASGLMGVVYEFNRTGHRMFAKDRATTRIDGAVSLAMSVGMATLVRAEQGDLNDFLKNPIWA